MSDLHLLISVLLLTGCAASQPPIQGVVECDEETLAFEVAGTVATVACAEGQRVAAGADLSRLDDRALRLAVAEAAAQVVLAQAQRAAVLAPARAQELASAEAEEAAAQARSRSAQADRDRIVALHDRNLASDLDRDRAIDAAQTASAQAVAVRERLALLREGARPVDIAVAEARVHAAQAVAARAEERLARGVLAAPGPRVVRHVHLRPGQVAQPGQPAVTVADSDRPYVDAFVPQARLSALRVGGAATVRVDGGVQRAGIIERIGERLEFTPRFLFGPEDRPDLVARVRIRLSTGEGLHAGVPADVDFAP